MPLVQIVVILLVFGIILWIISTVIPIDATLKKIIIAVLAVAVIIWLLSISGLMGYRIG